MAPVLAHDFDHALLRHFLELSGGGVVDQGMLKCGAGAREFLDDTEFGIEVESLRQCSHGGCPFSCAGSLGRRSFSRSRIWKRLQHLHPLANAQTEGNQERARVRCAPAGLWRRALMEMRTMHESTPSIHLMRFLPAVAPILPGSDSAFCFLFVDGKLLMPEGDAAVLPTHPVGPFVDLATARHYLGRLDGHDCWAMLLSGIPPGWRPVPLRAAMIGFPQPLQDVAGRAAQVLEWDRAHRYCGVCGTPTVAHPSDRARNCPACGYTAYPRLSPAMMALVWRDGEVLLARSPHYAAGMFSALAGFVEPGESIEDCVHREVAEEVSLRVKNLRYYGSQSWPFPHSLMIAFTAEWESGEIVPQVGEIEAAHWFPIDSLPPVPPRFSISGHLIRDTVDAMRTGRLRDRADKTDAT